MYCSKIKGLLVGLEGDNECEGSLVSGGGEDDADMNN